LWARSPVAMAMSAQSFTANGSIINLPPTIKIMNNLNELNLFRQIHHV
jgi:hypothetical protein